MTWTTEIRFDKNTTWRYEMWDVAVTFMLMFFGAFVVIAFGAILIWALYLIQNVDRNERKDRDGQSNHATPYTIRMGRVPKAWRD